MTVIYLKIWIGSLNKSIQGAKSVLLNPWPTLQPTPKRFTMTETHLPKLGTDLVTALSGLDVNNFSHGYGERGICLSQQAEAAVKGCLV
jgi:hypothetical protein